MSFAIGDEVYTKGSPARLSRRAKVVGESVDQNGRKRLWGPVKLDDGKEYIGVWYEDGESVCGSQASSLTRNPNVPAAWKSGRVHGLKEAAKLAFTAGCGKSGCTDCIGGALAKQLYDLSKAAKHS